MGFLVVLVLALALERGGLRVDFGVLNGVSGGLRGLEGDVDVGFDPDALAFSCSVITRVSLVYSQCEVMIP